MACARSGASESGVCQGPGPELMGANTLIGNDVCSQKGEFRRVLYTARNCQLVVMAPKPMEEIGAQRQKLDQFLAVLSTQPSRGADRFNDQ